MPQGKGTYGSKVGRPSKKKKIDPVKKKGSAKKKGMSPTGNQGMKRKRKKKPVNTPSAPAGYSKRTRMDMAAKEALSGGVAKKKKKAGQTGYGPQNRLGTFAKKKKVKTTGPKKKGYKKDAAAIAKGPKKKDNGGVKKPTAQMKSNYAKRIAAQKLRDKKAARARAAGKIIKENEKQRLKLKEAKRKIALKKRGVSKGKRKTLDQLRKEGKINF